jgi:hypothetical protein
MALHVAPNRWARNSFRGARDRAGERENHAGFDRAHAFAPVAIRRACGSDQKPMQVFG